MSDEERGALAQRAGSGDIDAARRLVTILKREGWPSNHRHCLHPFHIEPYDLNRNEHELLRYCCRCADLHMVERGVDFEEKTHGLINQPRLTFVSLNSAGSLRTETPPLGAPDRTRIPRAEHERAVQLVGEALYRSEPVVHFALDMVARGAPVEEALVNLVRALAAQNNVFEQALLQARLNAPAVFAIASEPTRPTLPPNTSTSSEETRI